MTAELLDEDVIDGVPVLLLGGGFIACYVGVERGHKLYGVDYDDVPMALHDAVNGGLTFSGDIDDKRLSPGPKKFKAADYWWFGWDDRRCLNTGTPRRDAKKAIKVLGKMSRSKARSRKKEGGTVKAKARPMNREIRARPMIRKMMVGPMRMKWEPPEDCESTKS